MLSIGNLRNFHALPQFSALRHRDYRMTWSASMLSGAALSTFIVATAWMVLEASGSSGWVGIITFSAMLPFLLVSPVAGLLGDTKDRKTVVVGASVAGGVVISSLAALSISGRIELWHVAVLAFALGVVRSTQEPAITALIPNQVPREDLLNAIVLNGATRHGARFFGVLVAAPMLAADSVGVDGVLVLSAVFQVLGLIQMARVRTRSTGQTSPERGMLRNMLEGLVYIYTHQTMALFVLLVAFHCALVMSFESILPVLSRESLGATDGSVFGYLFMAFGAGALVGMFALAAVRDDRRKGQLLLWTGLASGVSPMLLAISQTVAVGVLFAAAMGAAQATFMALTNAYVQTIVPDGLRSRISSLYILHAGGIMAFANLGYGFMADVFSAPPILIVTGALFVIVLLGLGSGQPILRRVYRTGEVAAA